jgi:hypothetical protein
MDRDRKKKFFDEIFGIDPLQDMKKCSSALAGLWA